MQNLATSLAEHQGGAVDRQRQIDAIVKSTGELVKVVEGHTLLIDRHSQALAALRWFILAVAVPVIGYGINLLIRAVEYARPLVK